MNNEESLISVIIPVYNVEKYLERCIYSVINQTYANFEVILIDDGSTDRSGQICENFSNNYTNIKTIHKENGGLSSARNMGLDCAHGEYITFVDSDDWIDKDMLKVLHDNCLQYSADIASTVFFNAFDDGSKIKNTCLSGLYVYSNIEALEVFLFNDYLTPCSCGKLWKSSLWKNFRFPEGKLFEDQFTTYLLLDRANRVVFNTNPMYYYFKRVGSIGHNVFKKETYQLHFAVNEECHYIVNKYPQLRKNLSVGKIVWDLVLVDMMIINNKCNEHFINELRCFIGKHLWNVINCKYLNKLRKFQILLFYYSYHLYRWTYLQYKKKHELG